PPSSAASASPFSSFRSNRATLTPFSARRRAVAAPRPEAPPVMTADILLLSSMTFLLFCFHCPGPALATDSHLVTIKDARRFRRVRLAQTFDNRDVRLSAAFAHGLQAIFRAACFQSIQQRSHQLRARCTQRVTQSNRAAVHVELATVCTDMLEPCQRNRSKSFVDFIEVNIFNSDACAFQSPLGGEQWLFQHDDRITGGYGQVDDPCTRRQAVVFQSLFRTDQNRARPVTDLAGAGSGQ